MEYKEEDYLMLSGLQHYKFCRRRWALIHIENQWAENYRTIDGELLHQNAHDKGYRESRGDRVIVRGLNVFSHTLGVTGQCDVVEFVRSDSGIPMEGREGLWQPYPVEYKRGTLNEQSGDTLQLCGQAMCLEEMLCCPIPEGALYYGEIRQRKVVHFSEELRQNVRKYLMDMHDLFQRGHTPKVQPTKACNACSLKELCLPKLLNKRSVIGYLKQGMGDF